MAWGIGPGDAVFVPSFTYVATAEAPAQLGATPFFVDVCDDNFNMDPTSFKQAIIDARQLGLKPAVVIRLIYLASLRILILSLKSLMLKT